MNNDLISRNNVILTLEKLRTYAIMEHKNSAYIKGVRDAMKIVAAADTEKETEESGG